jgi:hypothetical protein
MNPGDFIAQNVNKQIDLDGFPANQPFQCYDLANKWSQTLGYGRFTGLYASDIYGQQPQNYDWIPNSPQAVPQAGDVVVWNRNKGNGAGHVAIANGVGNTSYFESLDQNWSAPRAVGVRHDYSDVIGWGRPKKLTNSQGGIDVIVNDDNNYARANKLHLQVRGRGLDRSVFNAFVGKPWLTYIEALSDDKEADDHQRAAQVGGLAIRDKWDQQIYTLQDQVKASNDKLDKLQAKVDELTAKLATQSDDTKLLNGLGEILSKLIIRIGLKK